MPYHWVFKLGSALHHTAQDEHHETDLKRNKSLSLIQTNLELKGKRCKKPQSHKHKADELASAFFVKRKRKQVIIRQVLMLRWHHCGLTSRQMSRLRFTVMKILPLTHKCCISRILNAVHFKPLRLIPMTATSIDVHSTNTFCFAQPSRQMW